MSDFLTDAAGVAFAPFKAPVDALGNLFDRTTTVVGTGPAPDGPLGTVQSPGLTVHEPTLGELHNAAPKFVTDLPEPRGHIDNVNYTEHPLGINDPLHMARSSFKFADLDHPAAPVTPPAPAATPAPVPAPAPATHTEPAVGHGIEFDLDFGGGANGAGAYHLHLSGLDEQSAEDLIDHLSGADGGFGQGAASQPTHEPISMAASHPAHEPISMAANHPAHEPISMAANHPAHEPVATMHDAMATGDGPLGWDGNPVGAEHADWQTLRPADADDDLTHAHEAAGTGDEAAAHHMVGF